MDATAAPPEPDNPVSEQIARLRSALFGSSS
jgi:hypothetical protein